MWGFVDDVDVWRGWVGDADRDRGCKFITTHLVHVRALTRTRFHLCRGEGAGTGATARHGRHWAGWITSTSLRLHSHLRNPSRVFIMAHESRHLLQ